MSTAMRSIVERNFDLWNTGDLSIADEIFADDYVNHDANDPEVNDLATLRQLGIIPEIRQPQTV